MNLTMSQPLSYPFYMGSPRLPFSVPWSSNPFQFSTPSYQSLPSYPLPFILSHPSQQNLPPPPPPPPPSKTLPTHSSYTNTRYNHLKQSTSHINRHRSIDTSLHPQGYSIPNYHYRPIKTKSVSDFHQFIPQNSTHLLKAHSWHAINHPQQQQQLNPSYNHGREIPFTEHNHFHHQHQHHHHHQQQQPRSPKTKKKRHRNRSSSPQQNQQLPEPGLVRISTFDEMPIINNPIYRETPTYAYKTPESKHSTTHVSSMKGSSPSSTASSQSSFQKRLNGSLRNDPLLIAAMEDFRELRRTSSRSTSITQHQRDISRDSLCSNSTHHSSSSISRSHSQSSFTSLERLEIRNLIKTLKAKGLQAIDLSLQSSSSLIIPPPSEPCPMTKPTSIPIIKSKKSTITEELDREFHRIRLSNPNEELINVRPSLLQKQRTPISSLSTLDELRQQNPLQTFKQFDEKPLDNSITIIPVPLGSPLPSIHSKHLSENKPEYAIPMKTPSKVNLRSTKKDEQIRSFSFCKPIDDILNETRPSRPLSMFNWLQYGLTNPLPSTFSPSLNFDHHHHHHDNDKSLVKENIYASDIDVHLPLSNEKDYLNNQTSMTDYLSDYKEQCSNQSSTINEFSRLFTRSDHRKHTEKNKSKIKSSKDHHHHHLRCSIM